MLTTTLLCVVMFGAELDVPVSAIDASHYATLASLEHHFSEPELALATLFAMPVARVDGHVVSAETVLQRYAAYLSQVSRQVSPDKFSRIVQDIIQRDLPQWIQVMALETAMNRDWSEEQVAGVRKHLNSLWKREVDRLAKELSTREDQEPLPVSLEAIHQNYIRQGMARAYLESRMDTLVPVKQADMATDVARSAYWKRRGEMLNQFIDEMVSQAKIETAFAIK